MLEFEWDEIKAHTNAIKHGVRFEDAKAVFSDPFALELLDDRFDYGEDRFILIGMSGSGVLFVVWTERTNKHRIISARKATRDEADAYFKDADRG
jgi:uncharacterized protein